MLKPLIMASLFLLPAFQQVDPAPQPSSLIAAIITFLTAIAPLAIGANKVISRHADMIGKLQADLEKTDQALEDERNKRRAVQKDREKLSDLVGEMQTQLTELTAKQTQMGVEQTRLSTELNSVTRERDAFKEQNATHLVTITGLTERAIAAETARDHLQSILDTERNEWKVERVDLTGQIAALKDKLQPKEEPNAPSTELK